VGVFVKMVGGMIVVPILVIPVKGVVPNLRILVLMDVSRVQTMRYMANMELVWVIGMGTARSMPRSFAKDTQSW